MRIRRISGRGRERPERGRGGEKRRIKETS